MKLYKYTINGNVYNVTVNRIEDTLAEVEVNGTPYKVQMDKPARKQIVTIKRPVQMITGIQSDPVVVTPPSGSGLPYTVKAPLPGEIISIDCEVGDEVKKGQKLMVLEAMKMENTIPAVQDGKVIAIKVNKGDAVLENTDLIVIQ
jgi:biotin carboxyl carrier protein